MSESSMLKKAHSNNTKISHSFIAAKAFIKKEFLHIFRDLRTMMILILMPIVQILLFGFALSSEIRNVNFALLDLDKTQTSQKITQSLTQNPYFSLYKHIDSSDFMKFFNGNKADFILIIPSNFTQNLYNAGASLQLIIDASDANRASTINIYVSNIILNALDSTQNNLKISTSMLFNAQGKSAPSFVPGLLGMILMLICAMMTSVSIVREKELGSMEVLLISPLKPILVIISKVIPYFLLSCGILFLTLIVCVFVLDLQIVGSLSLLVCFCLLYIFLSLSIGLMVSNLAKTQVVAMLVCAMLFMMPVMMFSGMLFPVESMPKILQYFSHIIPAKWFIIGVKKVMIEGVGLTYIWKEASILCAFLCVVLFVSIKTYKIRL